MRIRRHAARLLASSAPTSPPPPDAASAPWLHAAADDCDFSQLTRGSDPQVAPGGSIKHKGHVHIAGPEPEAELLKTHDDLAQRPPSPEAPVPAQGELKNQLADRPPIPEGARHTPTLETRPPAPEELIPAEGELKNLAERLPIVEVQGCEIDHVHSTREDAEGLEIPREDAVSPELQVAYEGHIAGMEPEGELLKTHDDLAPRPPAPEEMIPAQGELTNLAEQPPIPEGALHTPTLETRPPAPEELIPVEGELKNLAERLPILEVEYCEIDHVHSAREDAAGLEIPREDAMTTELQVAYKGHIAGLEPEGELLQSDEQVDLSQQPRAPEPEDEVGSVSSTSSGPVRDKSSTADKVAPHDDTPSISCISDIVARSVGKSARTDIVCYARRRGKRKLDMVGMKTQEIKIDDGDIYDPCEEKTRLKRTAPCESAMSTAGSAEIKLSDIKRGLADNSASSKCKRRKGRFECDIDYCRMAFKKRSELSVHKKNMCTVKSCGKRFRSHKYLRRHQSIHNDDTPYKCPWEDCSMAFKWTWSLADHFQVHTGEKPYRCKTPGCSKIYKYVSDFIRHKKRCKPQVKT